MYPKRRAGEMSSETPGTSASTSDFGLTPPKASRPSPGQAQERAVSVVASKLFIYVFGGDASTSAKGTVARYDLQERRWERKGEMPVSGYGSGAAFYKNVVYLVGGIVNEDTDKQVHVYHPHTDGWSNGPPLLRDRAFPGLVVYNDRLYVMGGYTYNPLQATGGQMDERASITTDEDPEAFTIYTVCEHRDRPKQFAGGQSRASYKKMKQVLASSEMFDGKAWQPCGTPMYTERYAFGPVAWQEQIFIAGGFRKTALTSMEAYDGDSDTAQNSSMEIKRMPSVLHVVDGHLFVAGGHRDVTIAKCDLSASSSWTLVSPARGSISRRNVSIAVGDGAFYVIGGLERGGNSAAKNIKVPFVECYDVRNKVWSQLPSMDQGRCGFPTVVLRFGTKHIHNRVPISLPPLSCLLK